LRQGTQWNRQQPQRTQRQRVPGAARKVEANTMGEKAFVAVAKVAELGAGEKKVVEANGIGVILVNTRDRIFALRNLCSHAYETLECGRVRAGWISCPVHGARFDLETGAPLNPPATMPIETYEVRVEGEDILIAV